MKLWPILATGFFILCAVIIGHSAFVMMMGFIENEKNEAYTRGWREAAAYYEQRIEEIEGRIGIMELNIMESNQFVREAFLWRIVAYVRDTINSGADSSSNKNEVKGGKYGIRVDEGDE